MAAPRKKISRKASPKKVAHRTASGARRKRLTKKKDNAQAISALKKRVEAGQTLKNGTLPVHDQSGKQVDEKLMNLAKGLNGKILTTVFNLNRIATVSNIGVLNINDLANAVKTISLPGERMEIKIVHLGKDKTQGVGYLPDGTMIVIAGSADKIGQTIKVEVTKNIQTPAGRMIFAKEIWFLYPIVLY